MTDIIEIPAVGKDGTTVGNENDLISNRMKTAGTTVGNENNLISNRMKTAGTTVRNENDLISTV